VAGREGAEAFEVGIGAVAAVPLPATPLPVDPVPEASDNASPAPEPDRGAIFGADPGRNT
jgi:hypothetical protein